MRDLTSQTSRPFFVVWYSRADWWAYSLGRGLEPDRKMATALYLENFLESTWDRRNACIVKTLIIFLSSSNCLWLWVVRARKWISSAMGIRPPRSAMASASNVAQTWLFGNVVNTRILYYDPHNCFICLIDIDSLPREFQRNFNLIRDLDKRVQGQYCSDLIWCV